MERDYFDVHVDQDGTTAVVRLIGEVDLDTAPTVESCLEKLLGERQHDIVVDLSEVSLLDSSGVTVLLHGYRAARAGGGSLRVENPTAEILRVLEVAGVTALLGL